MGNYIFISYAHKDKDKVEPIIKYLHDSGLEVWYDKGIEVGTEWGNIIANKLLDCRMMIAFISPNYVESPNCNRETTFAVAKNKPAIVAYLEPTALTPELELNLCTWQAIYRNRFNSDEEFSQEIYRSKVVRGEEDNSLNNDNISNLNNTNDIQNTIRSNPMLRRGFNLLKEDEWNDANEQFERALDNDDNCAIAYIGKLMIDLHINKIEDLQNQIKPFDNNKNYIRFNRYANNNEQEQIDNYLNVINERIRKAETERKAREEAKRKVRAEAERKAREEAERKVRAEAEHKAREEAEHKAREEAEHKAREKAESIAKSFGHYPQGENDEIKPIEWQVLENDCTSVLLISKYALDCKQYHNKYETITWDKCDLRKWLNTIFINTAFTKEEQEKIKLSEVTADINPKCKDTPQGNNTKDKIFLLSIDEINAYFNNDNQRVTKGTPYCYKQGAYKDDDNGNCWWWLRTSGGLTGCVTCVESDGNVPCYGGYADNTDSAVRPALIINL